eukprot:80760_1
MNPTTKPEDSNPSTNKDTMKEIIFYVCGIVIVILLIVIGILLWIIYKYGNNKKQKNSNTIVNNDTTFFHNVSPEDPLANSPQSPTLISNSITQSNQLQLTNLINSSDMQQGNGVNHYGINSSTFNSDQNNINNQKIHHVNVIVPNDDADEADLPSSSSNDDESSSFSMNDKNNVIDDIATPKNSCMSTTNIGTPSTVRQQNNHDHIVALHIGNKSDENYNNNNNNIIMGVNNVFTGTSQGTTKGVKLPQPKTPGHWM